MSHMKPISQAFLQPTDKYWSFLHAMLSDEWAYKTRPAPRWSFRWRRGPHCSRWPGMCRTVKLIDAVCISAANRRVCKGKRERFFKRMSVHKV